MTTVELEHTLEAEEALSEDLQQYAGQWVAVRDEVVVISAQTLGELLDRVGGEEVDGVFEVPGGDCAVCFF